MAKYVAAIDQGTTSTRCMLFNHAGEPVSSCQMEHKQIYPQPGWVEHNAVEIWSRTKDVIHAAMEKAGLVAADIAAVGITNQRETAVVWDRRTGQPYHNAIVWQDTRTDAICGLLAGDGGQDRFRAKTGLPLATYFSGPKIKWLLDNVEGLREAAERGDALFGNMDTWIIWKLTGGINGGAHVTDVTNASRTMLMNLDGTTWDDEIIELMGIPKQMLPTIRPSSDPGLYGHTKENGPFGGKIPVCGDLGDQQAATVGQTCFGVGEAKNTYGTGCFMLLNTGTEIVHSKNGLLTTPCYKFGNEPTVYALEGSIAIAGAAVQWLRDQMRLINTAADVENLARMVEDNGGMYFVPAFSGLFAPYWKSDARGAIVGMTRYLTRGHFARAALEAVAYQTREVLDAMEADSGVKLKALKVDGGMVANELLMQYQADVLGVTVTRPKVAESTALGAAYAAGLAVGFWNNTDEMRQNWGVDKNWEPAEDDTARVKNFGMWKKAVTRTFDWVD
ncbi:MAG: glycerol kinase [Desulfuromonas sp.]|uniref:glycerol kinase GlpK n=1 Tax=Desulfuromonas sp. TaxID=892 RepID=UPI000CB511A1|nr:glycerol kinase GlpK [Desulfuromonas sp.]PLX85931.1 MAG: glycerol kinase [Desulfuromonas sp.]